MSDLPGSKYSCTKCNYCSYNKAHYQRHIQTDKHRKKSGCIDIVCDNCGKLFKHSSNYYRHRKNRCPSLTSKDDIIQQVLDDSPGDPEYLKQIIKMQFESHTKTIENIKESHQKTIENIKEIVTHQNIITNNTTNNTTNNNNLQVNNNIITGQKTIQFLNQHLPDMIDMETFIEKYKSDYQLDETQTKTLLESYQLNGVKSYAKCLSFFLKDNCNRQLKDKNIEYPRKISFPLTLTDSNLRSIKVKTENGWDTTTDDQVLSRIIVISNDQVYRHHQTGIYLPEAAKNVVITYIKKDNPFQKIKNSFESIKN
jgi:hypothetical protein